MTTETVLIFPEIMREWEGTDNALSFARAIEQAVLQSEQAQGWKRDSERYRWLRETPDAEVRIFIDQPYGGREMSDHFLDEAIDAAKEQQI